MITDPYCPPVWATSPNDIPLVVKSVHELPTASGGAVPGRIELYDTLKRLNINKSQTYIKIPFIRLQNLSELSGK